MLIQYLRLRYTLPISIVLQHLSAPEPTTFFLPLLRLHMSVPGVQSVSPSVETAYPSCFAISICSVPGQQLVPRASRR